MKKTIFFAVVVLFIAESLSSSIFAQKMKAAEGYTQTILFEPIEFLRHGKIEATYERKLTQDNSFTVSLDYWKLYDWSSIGIGVSYRWYFNEFFNNNFKLDKNCIEGFSVGPRAEFWKWGYSGSYTYDDYTTFAIGVEAGYKWIFNGGWTVEPGLRYMYYLNRYDYNSYDPYAGMVNIGYSW